MPFSEGYDLGQFFVYPHKEKTQYGWMAAKQHQKATNRYCPEGNPLIMKIGNQHFIVNADSKIPTGTLSIDRNILSQSRIKTPPELTEVLIMSEPSEFENIVL